MTSSNGWANRAVFAGILIALLTLPTCYADSLTVGVAANFRSTLEQVAIGFQSSQKTKVNISAASTGALFAQVINGAPFDIVFAADSDRPRLLESRGHTRLRQTYAYGQLAFWSPGITASYQSLLDYKGTLAVANPKHAPYGKAAIESLDTFKVAPGRLVYGTNIAQAFNFVMTGNAPAGMVALSQLRMLQIPGNEYWNVPDASHQPIEQQLVVMKSASPEAEQFLRYLFSAASTELIRESGYRTAETAP